MSDPKQPLTVAQAGSLGGLANTPAQQAHRARAKGGGRPLVNPSAWELREAAKTLRLQAFPGSNMNITPEAMRGVALYLERKAAKRAAGKQI